MRKQKRNWPKRVWRWSKPQDLPASALAAERSYVLVVEEDQSDACEDEMKELLELLSTGPAICPTP